MTMNVSLPTISNKISSFFDRYHFIIFFIFIGSGLIAAVAIINGSVLSPQDDGYVSQINGTGFDQETMQRLRSLKTTGETVEKLEFSGRITPF